MTKLSELNPEASARACQVCGVRVDAPTHIEEFVSEGAEFEMVPGSGWTEVGPNAVTIELTRCADCLVIRDEAQRLVDLHPAVFSRRGDAEYQLLLAESALIAIHSLGPMVAMFVKGLTGSDRDVQMLIDHLGSAGGFARFSTNIVPVARLGFGPRTCSITRWSHVSDERKQIIARAYAELIEDRVGPAQVPPPADGLPGCVLCGVATTPSFRSKSGSVWGRRYEVPTAVIGGRPSPVDVVGYACPLCRPKIEQYGLGLTAMEHSLLDYLGTQITPNLDGVEIPWLVGFAALPEGTKPHAQPWQHVDLDSLRDSLESAANGTRPRAESETVLRLQKGLNAGWAAVGR